MLTSRLQALAIVVNGNGAKVLTAVRALALVPSL
jgi:hypothetical protein